MKTQGEKYKLTSRANNKSAFRFLPTLLLCTVLSIVLSVASLGCVRGDTEIQTSTINFNAPIKDQPTNTAAVPEAEVLPQTALVTFAGDCTFSSTQDLNVFNGVYDEEGSAYFFSGVLDIFANDDLTVVNLEGTFTSSTDRVGKPGDGNFWFRSPPEYIDILTQGSVEAVNTANNHSYDYGQVGYDDTLATLDSAQIAHFGYDDTIVIDVNGIKIGFLGFAFDSNASNIQIAMDELRANGAEVIVAYFHDGIELDYYPSSSQINAAYAAIDYGASAVLMSHPHVIQGTETYNGKFIAYSMGNFCFGGNTNPSDKDSMIVQLYFERGADEITCVPTVIPCSITSTQGINDYRPQVFDGQEAARLNEKIAEYSR